MRLHLEPGLGRRPLAKLQPAHVQQFMTGKLSDGQSVRSVRYSRVVLRAALGQAMKLGLVARNVAALTTAPKGWTPRRSRPSRRMKPAGSWTGWRAIGCAPSASWMLFLGLRQGEALGLRWPDVDLEGAVCHVRVELTRRGHEY